MDREEELREALELAERVREDPSLLGEGTDTAEYWKSVEDVQQKLEILQQAKEVEAHPERYEVPEGYREQVAAVTSPFATITPDRVRLDVVSAIKAGQLTSELERFAGKEQVQRAKEYIAQEKEYGVSTATQAALLRELEPYKTPEGYNLVDAIRAGKIEAVRKAGFDPLDVVEAQSQAADVGVRERALALLTPWQTGEGKEASFYVGGALASGISASTIATALGRPIKEIEAMRPVTTPTAPAPPAEEKGWFEKWFTSSLVKPFSLEPGKWYTPEELGETRSKYRESLSPLAKVGSLILGEKVYESPAQLISYPEFTLATAGLAAAGLPAKIPGLAEAFGWAVKPVQVGQVTQWPARFATGVLTATKFGAITGGVTTGTVAVAGLLLPTVAKPELTMPPRIDITKIGTTEAYGRLITTPEGKIDVPTMVERYGEGETIRMLAQAGQGPTVAREVWERLPEEQQKFYTPSERYVSMAYEPGISGVLGRGVEVALKPPLTTLGVIPGIPGMLARGMYQWAAPLTLVSETWGRIGPKGYAMTIPHFGPTIGAPIVTGMGPFGIVAGAGFAALPGVIGAAAPPVLGWMRGFVREGPKPWFEKGYYHPVTGEPMAQVGSLWKTVPQWEAYFRAQPKVAPQAIRIDIAEAMKGPQPITLPKGYKLGEAGGIVPEVYKPAPGEVKIGTSWYKPGPGYEFSKGAVPAIVQQVTAPTFFTQLQQLVRQVPTIVRAAPRAAMVMPAMSLAVLPAMVAPAITIPVDIQARVDIGIVDQMLKDNLITKAKYDQIVQQIKGTQQDIKQDTGLTEQQKAQLYQNEVTKVIQAQLTTDQQQYVQQYQQEVQKYQQTQQQLQQEQQKLQQIQQRQVDIQQIQQQQQIVQRLQQQVTQQEARLPQQMRLVLPFLPLEDFGAATMLGGGRLGRGIKKLLKGGIWAMPALPLTIQDPLRGRRYTTIIAKKRQRKYGAAEPATGGGIRL